MINWKALKRGLKSRYMKFKETSFVDKAGQTVNVYVDGNGKEWLATGRFGFDRVAR